MSTGKEPLDEVDKEIARYMMRARTYTNESIAQTVGLSVGAVQPRVRRLREQHILTDVVQVKNWSAIGYPLRHRIDILINPLELRGQHGGGPIEQELFVKENVGQPAFAKKKIETQEALSSFIKYCLVSYVAWRIGRSDDDKENEFLKGYNELVHVQDVTMLLGHHADLTATVRSDNTEALRKFVTDGLRLMRGITNTSTAQEVWSCLDGDHL